MASTSMLGLYPSWNKYEPDNHVSFDESPSVSLSGFRKIDGHTNLGYTPESPRIVKTKRVVSTQVAVEVKDAVFNYGSGKKLVSALRGINLTVPAGGIYGLLGPSGCGKTTLLRCMVGRLRPQHGSLTILGMTPGDPNSLVPGPAIGYMPQELALFPDFTIEETLTFFARLYNMNDNTTRERVKSLLQFLELPDKNRLVGNLSGGQKRRVSLAAALVHHPPLLILDEPTVGVDPVLRQAIWDHLVSLTKTGNLTVLITTHYIEEARAADVVGLMRFGRLLTEASPEFLLQRFNSPTLEEVFLKLCQTDGLQSSLRKKAALDLEQNGKKMVKLVSKPDICTDADGKSILPNGIAVDPMSVAADSQLPRVIAAQLKHESLNGNLVQNGDPNGHQIFDESVHQLKSQQGIRSKVNRTSALFHKNLIRLRRNLPVLLFQFLLPSIEVILFCICIGRDPFDIPVAVVNYEDGGYLSEWFLQSIDNYTIIQHRFNNTDEALRSVKDGHAWAALVIGGNFTNALELRTLAGGSVTNDTVRDSTIHVHLDMTNQIIGYKLQRTLLASFQDFSREVLTEMNFNPLLVEIPLQMENPVYGDRSPTFTEFMAPGVLLSIAFLAAVALTALAFVMERKEGLLERSLVAGVTSLEFLLSHVLTQLLVLVVQICLLLLFTFIVFQIPSRGPFIWVILLTLLQGCCGMAYGLMISSICKEENSATMLALGSFYPNLLMSGTVWPTQSMPIMIRYVSYFLPQTIPIEAMRYVLSRGWDITHPEVILGFGITTAWTLFFLTAAVFIFKHKH